MAEPARPVILVTAASAVGCYFVVNGVVHLA